MDEQSNGKQAVELLQQLGLKEYEAKSFVALTRMSDGTAKAISNVSDVPRTRVYDAIRVLETKGLVEIQHSNPQVFRAVSIDEAAATLRAEYESRTTSLEESLRAVEPAGTDPDEGVSHEVWALSGGTAITNRTRQLVEETTTELVFVVGVETAISSTVVEAIDAAVERGVNVLIGTYDEASRDELAEFVPGAEVFVSNLEWLRGNVEDGDGTTISRLLLVDRSTILVSTIHDDRSEEPSQEQAVFGRGFDNGFVTIVRRLMAMGLLPIDDPGIQDVVE